MSLNSPNVRVWPICVPDELMLEFYLSFGRKELFADRLWGPKIQLLCWLRNNKLFGWHNKSRQYAIETACGLQLYLILVLSSAFPYQFKYLILCYFIDYSWQTWHWFNTFPMLSFNQMNFVVKKERNSESGKIETSKRIKCERGCCCSVLFASFRSLDFSQSFQRIVLYSLFLAVSARYICIQQTATNCSFQCIYISNARATKWIEYRMNYKWFLMWPTHEWHMRMYVHVRGGCVHVCQLVLMFVGMAW